MSDAIAHPPSRYAAQRKVSVRALQNLNRFFVRAYHQLEVISPCRLPASGPAIIACNHTSGIDPLFIQSCSPRLITWMMAAEFMDLPVLSGMFKTIGIIPVARSGRDMAATRAAMRALHEGQILGIFPEGKIESGSELLPFQSGVALMAMKTGVPVYPAYLDGSQRGLSMLTGFLQAQRAVIAFGMAVEFDRSDPGREGQERATAAIRGAVETLRRQAAHSQFGRLV
ncbi:MAG: lysophospholipid acyltransferase family protein [Tepidisphaeraceae bacterium]